MNDTQYRLVCFFDDGAKPNNWDNERWAIQLIHPSSDAPLWEHFVSASRYEFGKALVAAQDWMDQNVRVEPCTPTEARQRRLDTSDVDLRMASMFPVVFVDETTEAGTKQLMTITAKKQGFRVVQDAVLERIDG